MSKYCYLKYRTIWVSARDSQTTSWRTNHEKHENTKIHAKISLLNVTILTIIREIIIVLICLQISLIRKRYCRRLLRKQISESLIRKVDIPLRRSQIYYQSKLKVRNQNLSKNIADIFLEKLLHWFLGCISWDWSHLTSKVRIYYFLSVLDEFKCFIEVNLIKESCSLIEILLKPHTQVWMIKFH